MDNMDPMTKLLELASDLDDYMKGNIKHDFILKKYFTETYSDLEGVIANLGHYFDDADIRAEEQDYREMQDNEIKKLIHLLQCGRLEQARRINFLHKSKVNY